MIFAHGTTVTLRSVTTTTNDHGDSTTVPVDRSWGPCAIAPRTSTERADSNSPAVVVGLTIMGPPVVIDSDDLIVITSGYYAGTWQVEGIPGDYSHPMTGWRPGVEVAVKRASGT